MPTKQYISIIRLFNHCDIEIGLNLSLPRVKKQLQAEFNISQGSLIEVEGFTYTRNDVMAEIEHPDFLKQLEFHQRIWERKQMLQILEENQMELELMDPKVSILKGNKDFTAFISPYFAGPFNYISRTFITTSRFNDLGHLLEHHSFLLADEIEEAFRPLKQFLEDGIRTLRNVNKENFKIMRPNLGVWFETEWPTMMNKLPHEFEAEKHQIIVMLINLTVALEKSQRSSCKRLSAKLMALEDIPEDLSGLIISNHAVFNRSRYQFNLRNNWWIGFIIFMVIKGVASNGCKDDTPNFNKTPLQFSSPTIDSLRKSMTDQDTSTFPKQKFGEYKLGEPKRLLVK